MLWILDAGSNATGDQQGASVRAVVHAIDIEGGLSICLIQLLDLRLMRGISIESIWFIIAACRGVYRFCTDLVCAKQLYSNGRQKDYRVANRANFTTFGICIAKRIVLPLFSLRRNQSKIIFPHKCPPRYTQTLECVDCC